RVFVLIGHAFADQRHKWKWSHWAVCGAALIGWFGLSDGWRISCWPWLRPKAVAPKSPLSAIVWGQGLGRIASCIGLPLQGIPHSKPIVNYGLISYAVF